MGLYRNPAPGEVCSARVQRVMPRGSGRWRSRRAKRRLLVIWLAYRRLKQQRTWRSIWVRPIFARGRSQGEYHNLLYTSRSLYAFEFTFHKHSNTLTSSINLSSSPIFFSPSYRVPIKTHYQSHDTFEQSDWRDAAPATLEYKFF